MIETTTLGIDDVTFRDDLYPRARADDAAITRYRMAVDRLPPIAVAGPDRILVDGYHGWQARKREGLEEVEVEDLGDLSDQQILEESIRRNATHGHQLSGEDKRKLVIDRLWDAYEGTDAERARACADLLSVTKRTVEKWTSDLRNEQEKALKRRARVMHLTGSTQQQIADALGVPQQTISDWLTEMRTSSQIGKPPASRQVYDVWDLHRATGNYFGRLPPAIIENLLWLYTEPEGVVFDPFAGSGTTILVAVDMGRKVYASDISPSDLTLPIHEHDVLEGWPADAPKTVDFVLLDPPYWKQARGKYPTHKHQLGDMALEQFMEAWEQVVATCAAHLAPGGKLAYIVGATQESWDVVDHAFQMYEPCLRQGLRPVRRIVVTYHASHTSGAHVEKAKAARNLLVRYRDLVVLEK